MTTLSVDHMGKRAQFTGIVEALAQLIYDADCLLSPPASARASWDALHQATRDHFRDAARRAVALQLPDLSNTASSRAIDYALKAHELDGPDGTAAVSVVSERIAEDAIDEYSSALLRVCREAEARIV